MNSKPMLFECLGECKETYLADNLCDGYRCPKCNGYIAGIGFIKELEERTKDMQDKINRAKENGLIRKYNNEMLTRQYHSDGKVARGENIIGIDLSDKKDYAAITINVNSENIDKDKLIEQIMKNLNNPKRSGCIG